MIGQGCGQFRKEPATGFLQFVQARSRSSGRGEAGSIEGTGGRVTTTALKHFVRAFRDSILVGGPPEDWCYLISAPLRLSLRALGIDCALAKGSVYGQCHFWIELPDGTIIDATASQFPRPNGRAMPVVYIGEQPEWYCADVINYIGGEKLSRPMSLSTYHKKS